MRQFEITRVLDNGEGKVFVEATYNSVEYSAQEIVEGCDEN